MVGLIIRPSDLTTERTNPVASEWLVIDNGVTVAKVRADKAVEAGRPTASQAEAEAGTDPSKAMTPLTTKQAIDAQVPAKITAAIDGLATVATTGSYNDLIDKPTLSDETSAQSRAWAIANLHPISAPTFIRTAGYALPGDGGAALYKYVVAEPSHSGKFSITLEDGVTVAWYEIAEDVLTPQMFGPTGAADDFATFQAWSATTVAMKRRWYIPRGTYVLNGASAITLVTGGVCDGIIEIPKNNHSCRFEILRDNMVGTVLSTAGWVGLTRGASDINALNAMGKNLFFSSTQVLMERWGSGGVPYYRQEFVRCRGGSGELSTGLVNGYSDLAQLTVTAFEPSQPITIDGLNIRVTGSYGGSESYIGKVWIRRDNVTMNRLSVVNANPADPFSVAVDVGHCADVVFNEPNIVVGNFPGVGYGINCNTTIGTVIRGGNILQCRHSVAGRNNVDWHILGGNHSYNIDDHWGDRMVIRDVTVEVIQGYGAIEFAGNDITIENLTQFGGRNLLGIRADTPQLGGKVIIRNCRVFTRGEAGNSFWFFGFSSMEGPSATPNYFAAKPKLPDTAIVEDCAVDTDQLYAYGAYLSRITSQHLNWGVVHVCNIEFSVASGAFGIYYVKDSTYALDRSARLIAEDMDCKGGQAIYADALDNAITRSAVSEVRGIRGSSTDLRFRPYSVGSMNVSDSNIRDVFRDGAETMGSAMVTFASCKMLGTTVANTLGNIMFSGCVFGGVYSTFPASGRAMLGNTRTGAQGALPANIQTLVESPFN